MKRRKSSRKSLSSKLWAKLICIAAVLLAALFYNVSPQDILNGNFGKSRYAVESAVEIPPSPMREEGMVRVCIWNVHCYLDTYRMKNGRRIKSPKPEDEKMELVRIIKSINPDVLGIEEIGGLPYAREFVNLLSQNGLNYPYFVVSDESSEFPQCAILSKIKFEKTNHLAERLFEYFGEKTRSPRGMLIADFKTNGKDWRFGSIHLKSKFGAKARDKENNLMRQKEAEEISKDISSYIKKGGMIIIGGDFNEEPSDGAIKILKEKAGFVHLPQAGQDGTSFSYLWDKKNERRQFDFFLVSPAMKSRAKDATVLPVIKSASDHAPVYTDLDFSRN